MMKGVFVSLLLVLVSCSSSVPKDILPLDKMYPAVRDITLVDELMNTEAPRDSAVDVKLKRSKLYEQVFMLHNTTKEQFYKSYNYYQRRPDLQKQLFDSLAEGMKVKVPPAKSEGRKPVKLD